MAAQLMEAPAVRVFNTFSMGVERGQVAPLRWHADYPVFSGGGDCDKGVVAWMPVKVTSNNHCGSRGIVKMEGPWSVTIK